MITHNEMVDLLTYVSAADQRPIEQADVKVWLDAARDAKWPSASVAYRAIVRHLNAQPNGWIKPGHVTAIIRAAEQDARTAYRRPSPPLHVQRMKLEQQDAWFREQWQQHRQTYLEAWAANKPRGTYLRAVSA